MAAYLPPGNAHLTNRLGHELAARRRTVAASVPLLPECPSVASPFIRAWARLATMRIPHLAGRKTASISLHTRYGHQYDGTRRYFTA